MTTGLNYAIANKLNDKTRKRLSMSSSAAGEYLTRIYSATAALLQKFILPSYDSRLLVEISCGSPPS